MKARIIEKERGKFIVKILGQVKDWPWSKPRDHWEAVKDWTKAFRGYSVTVVPDRIFHSLAEAEQYIADRQSYPRLVKEVGP